MMSRTVLYSQFTNRPIIVKNLPLLGKMFRGQQQVAKGHALIILQVLQYWEWEGFWDALTVFAW